jgi:hypothetical protein
MATRTIVTSQPDVACDVCSRRLLRGEQPDVFVDAGRRRTVCELCAPRAAHEGWMRETDTHSLTLPPARARRGRSLIGRLLQATRAPVSTGAEPLTAAAPAVDARRSEVGPGGSVFDAYAGPAPVPAQPAPAAVAAQPVSDAPLAGQPAFGLDDHVSSGAGFAGGPSETPPAELRDDAVRYLPAALDVFNASEFPRRVAGVLRSLGAPLVTVRSAEHLASVVRIVVAWELCWYRYEVDLSEPSPQAQMIAQGSELAELAREDRQGNAVAGDSGQLALAGA